MKKILSQPKIVIPMFAVCAVIITYVLYGRIGIAPTIPLSINTSNSITVIVPGTNVSLSFAKNGRIESVLVKTGDTVKKGQVLAKLSAGDAEGMVSQAKSALDIAQAQYVSLNTEYANTKKQQDLLVLNAYKTLLSNSLEGVPSRQDVNVPIITGTYLCGKEGSYILKSYPSGDSSSGYSMNYSGLETGVVPVKYTNSVALGSCGLQIKFTHIDDFNPGTVWTISIPNTKGATYLVDKNVYDLAVSNRDKVLTDLMSKIGDDPTVPSVAKAQIDAAKGAYEAALGAYQNNLIIAPVDGTVSFIDPDMKIGQSAISGKSVISITQ